ncbi:hypothetical protein HOF56_05035, partial [Candidatus Peribacteria bacterium]|nr:hypothetical protein [Candidatus Peribacteria bacterium]
KDRNSATEQFIRRNEKRKGFEDIGTTAGYEAVRQLMDAENPVPVSDLLDWRANARAAGFNGKFSEGAPDQVRAVVGKISSKLGSLEKQSYSRDEEEERGYEIMLKAFEALCIDVAAGDPDVPDTIQDGEALIRRRYVNFSEAYLNSVKGLPQLLQDVASKRPGGGFSMLDVLVYERPTPAANAEIFQNETMAEWMFRKAGISVDWAKSMFKKGYAPMEIYAKHLKERTPAIYRSGKEVFIDGYDSLVEHLTPIYKKVGMEISEEWDAAMKMFFNAVSAAGIVLSKTPDGIEFALREGKELSVGAVRSIYLELARHHVTGPVLNLFERFVRRVFKGEILDLITLLETVETDNEHVEALADLENMKSNLVKHLNSVIEIEESLGGDDVDEWVVDAYEELSGESLAGANTAAQINAFSKVQAYEKMAVYELVKRRAYSFVIAKYLEEKNRVGKDKIKFPIKVRDSWPEGLSIMGGNAENIDSIYGWNVLRFIDIENSMSGAIEKSIEGMDPGVKRGFCEIATIPVNRAMHENAHDYIARSRKWFRDTFMRNAEEVFDGLPEDEKQEKLRHYKAYLDTLMTNVAIEITLGKINGDFVDVHDEGNIMELSISRAQDYLLYLKYYRGSSMNPMKISDLKLNSFAPESDKNALSELKKIAGDPEDSDSSIEEKTMPLSDAEKEKTTNIVNKIKDGKLKKLTPEEKRLLLGGIATGDVGVGTVKDKFNDNVEKLENMGSSEVRKDCLVHLCIVSPEKRSEIHEKLLGYFDKPTDEKINDLVDLSVFKEKIPAEFHDQIQIALDRAAVKMFKEVCREIGEVENMTKFDDMAKEKTNDAGGKRFKKWKEYIVKLYSVADETDPYFGKTSHLISYALEFLLYKGGDATYEQYKKDLNTLGREMRVRDLNPLPANAYAVYDPPGWFDGKTWPKLIDRLSVDSRGMALDPKVHMNPPIVVANKL